MEYTYQNITNTPNLASADLNGDVISGVYYDVLHSDMLNKSINYCRWDDGVHVLLVYVDGSVLSEADKNMLDVIVENNS
jgi:hypothetical protein